MSHDIGPSPNGKALDSDSSILQVRILVGQLYDPPSEDGGFFCIIDNFIAYFANIIYDINVKVKSLNMKGVVVKMIYSMKTRVGYSEISSEGYMTAGDIVDALQDCSNFQSQDIGVGLEYLISEKRAWLLNSWQIIFDKPMQMGDEIEVSTWAYKFDKLFGYRNFMIKDKEGNECVRANSTWFMVDLNTFCPCRLTDKDVEKYELSPRIDMEYKPRKIKFPSDMETIDTIRVHRYHIDTNGHMNNAWYVKIAMEYIDDPDKVREIRVEYRASAKLNDIVTIKRNRISEKCTDLGMYDKEDVLYASFEIIVGD